MRVGLISDTHMPQRWKTLPAIIFSLFSEIDLILHAGDVGELWVLDELSSLAPVVAVHGNDETNEATAALPFLQTVMLEGHRIVITHSHYSDRTEELESRKSDAWYPKLQYRADFGKAHGAKIVFTGHTHIPMVVEHDGVLIINAGAIASGNSFTRQTIQTVAIMEIEADTAPIITHYDLATAQPYNVPFDASLGFKKTAEPYQASIVDEEIHTHATWLWQNLFPIAGNPLRDAIGDLMHTVWSGERDIITAEQLVDHLKTSDNLPPEIVNKLKENPTFAQYL